MRTRPDRDHVTSPRRVATILAALVLLMTALVNAPAGAAEPSPAGAPPLASAVAQPDFRPLDPTRLADTRPGRSTVDGQFAGVGLVQPDSPLVLTVGGRGGVPASGVAAVALNITITEPRGAGLVTVYPRGEARPTTSNMNYGKGQTIANGVIAKLGADNKIVVYSGAAAHVIVDVSGYFTAGGVDALVPARLADTRPGRFTIDGQAAGHGLISPTAPLTVQVTGRGGVPASGVTAVALNLTVTGPTGGGFLTAFPTGTARPGASNVNFAKGQTVANSAVVKVGTGGRVTLHSAGSSSHAIVDVAGYFTTASDYVPLNPARFADTRASGAAVAAPSFAPGRTSTRVGPIGTTSPNGNQIDVLVAGRGGVPLTDTGAVVLNVTVTSPSHGGHVTVFPMDTFPPTASSVNFTAKSSVPNLVVAKLGRGGGISIVSSVPLSHLIVDVLGYFPGVSTADVPRTYAAAERDELRMPVSYDRCWTIPYKINPAGAQPGWINDVRTAIGQLEAATGIDFHYEGTSTQRPTTNPMDLDHTLIAFTNASVIPDLAGGVIGLGGSVFGWLGNKVRWIPTQYFYGFAYFDTDHAIPSGFGTGPAFGQVALHELAHVVGLGHVDNIDEIMNASTINRGGGFGPGDLEGLGLLYKTQSCPESPATFGSALRLDSGKPVPDGADLRLVTTADVHGHDGH